MCNRILCRVLCGIRGQVNSEAGGNKQYIYKTTVNNCAIRSVIYVCFTKRDANNNIMSIALSNMLSGITLYISLINYSQPLLFEVYCPRSKCTAPCCHTALQSNT